MVHNKLIINKKHFSYIALIAIALLFVIVLLPNESQYSAAVGYMILVVSAFNVYLNKNSKILLVLFAVLFYINLSVVIPGFVWKGNLAANYQFALWHSGYSTIYAKCLLIVNVVFSAFFFDTNDLLNSDEIITYDKYSLQQFDNPILSIIAFLILVAIFIFCFDGTSVLTGGAYKSNGNALYEYSIFFFVISWVYGRKKRYIRIIWVILASYYILTGLLTGDRSSCFMLIILIVIYSWRNASLTKMIFYSFAAIVSANTIAILRNSAVHNDARTIIGILIDNGPNALFSDTAYYSCYSGLTVLAYSDIYDGSKLILFLKWIVSLLAGSVFVKDDGVELVSAARQYYFNGGGGLFPAYFYFYAGFIGVLLASILAAFILRRVYFKSNNNYTRMLQLIIPAMSLRWYLYSPATLFRSCLINFGIIYLFFVILNSIIEEKLVE